MTLSALCLAMAMYGEARGEGVDGMLHVAETVINRVSMPSYPDTICGVVNQPSQYAPKLGYNKEWKTAAGLAEDILVGEDILPQTGATHFHSGKAPYWAGMMRHVATYGAHRFYKE